MFADKKEKKERMSIEEAFAILEDWLDFYECRLIGDDRESVKKDLWKAVQMERLSLDKETEKFKYVLKSKIQKTDGGGIEIFYLQEPIMDSKRDISKMKDRHSKGVANLQTYCIDEDGKEIPIGFLGRVKERDEITLSAIILGFFVQAVPVLTQDS